MSKASKIRNLYQIGLTVKEIADEVGCLPEYVRVCARQRTNAWGVSKNDVRYLKKRFGAKTLHEAWRRYGRHYNAQRRLYPLGEAA